MIVHSRLHGLDVFRGWALFLMILFHFAYDLNHFKFIDINMHYDSFWVYARYLIVSMFLLSMGVSLALVHRPKIQWHKMYKRTLMLGVSSALVSIATYIEFPHTWVYFGILHFILVASWVGLLFLHLPRFSLFLASVIFIGYKLGYLHTHWLFSLLQAPLHLPPGHTEDLVIFFPWFSVVLLGIALVGMHVEKNIFMASFLSHASPFNTFFALIGKHTLIIYLIHQPILFTLVSLFA